MKNWLSAARLRTLPLAFSCIIIGNSLAYKAGEFSVLILLLTLITTLFLQILSNFANDYGDFQNGADLVGRIGPKRAVQSGEISQDQMKSGIILMIFLSLITGIALLYFSFEGNFNLNFWLFLLIGVLSILAAYKYTAGRNPYGYSGFGDISVFVFFGIVGVIGSCYLQTNNFQIQNILPAISCGLLATGVLNINNIRDIKSDTLAGKMTIPARIGREKAIVYHGFLLGLAIVSTVVFLIINQIPFINWLVLISFILFIVNFVKVKNLPNPDSQLKFLALSTFVFSIFFACSINAVY